MQHLWYARTLQVERKYPPGHMQGFVSDKLLESITATVVNANYCIYLIVSRSLSIFYHFMRLKIKGSLHFFLHLIERYR